MNRVYFLFAKSSFLRFGVFISISLLSGCQYLDILSPQINYINDPIKGYTVVENISYGIDKNVSFDLYKPTTLSENPSEVVILLHGGGWTGGDKKFLQPSIDLLQRERKNLAIVNLNYRLVKASTDKDLITTQLHDLESIIAFLKLNAKKYNIRTDNYHMAGSSAGGHLALTYAYLSKENVVTAIIAASAPIELSVRELFHKSLWPNAEALTGKKYSDSTDAFKNASPFYLANYRSPKTILVYGKRDTLVYSIQADILEKKLRLLRVPVQYTLYSEEKHDISPRRFSGTILESFQ